MRLLGNHESHQLPVQLLDLLDVLGLVRLVLQTLEAEKTADERGCRPRRRLHRRRKNVYRPETTMEPATVVMTTASLSGGGAKRLVSQDVCDPTAGLKRF